MSGSNITSVVTVTDEARWLGPCLREAAKTATAILVLDGGSGSRTLEICRSFPGVEYRRVSWGTGDNDEWQAVRQWALAMGAGWLLLLAAHEVPEEGAACTIFRAISRLDPRDPIYTFFYLRILYFWNDPELYRCEDSLYGDSWEPRLLLVKDLPEWPLTPGSIGYLPQPGKPSLRGGSRSKGRRLDLCLKNYACVYPAGRQQQFEAYKQRDPEGAARGEYNYLLKENGLFLAKWRDRDREQVIPGPFIKPLKYYQHVPPEAAGLIPEGAKKILHLGCGQGILGYLLKAQDPGREIVGIEMNQMAAAAAMGRLDYVLVGDIEKMDLNFPVGYFDCIIMLGVLEHLRNPWDTLLYIKRFLHQEGCLILSVPNVRNMAVLEQLINEGRWPCQEGGIFDRGHLRFFTMREIQDLLASLNMVTEKIQLLRDPAVPELGAAIERNKFSLKNLTRGELNELQTKEFLIKARFRMPVHNK